ncbi:hypothetical protein ABS784_01720 [Geobacillus sp. G4]|uniref:hypothetical protein n=1 Tax=Geobacillus sp. G4 TaxID=3169691 RepID=UPI00333DB54A
MNREDGSTIFSQIEKTYGYCSSLHSRIIDLEKMAAFHRPLPAERKGEGLSLQDRAGEKAG